MDVLRIKVRAFIASFLKGFNNVRDQLRNITSYSLYNMSEIFIQFPYYGGTIPYKWDSKNEKAVPIQTKMEQMHFILNIIYVSTLKVAALLDFLLQLKTGNFSPSSFTDMQTLITTMAYTLSLVTDSHMIWKRNEMHQLLNSQHLFYRKLASKGFSLKKLWKQVLLKCFFFHFVEHHQFKDTSRETNLKSTRMLIAFCVPLFLMTLPYPFLFLNICKLHILNSILDTCSPDLFLWHSYLLFLVQLHVSLCSTSSVFFSILLFVPFNIFVDGVLKNLEKALGKTGKGPNWRKIYRSCQILSVAVNTVVGNSLTFARLTIIITLDVFILAALIKLRLPVLIRVRLTGLQLLLLVYFYVEIRLSSLSNARSVAFLHMLRIQRKTTREKKELRSFTPIKFHIGILSESNKLALLTILNIIVSNAGSVIIMI